MPLCYQYKCTSYNLVLFFFFCFLAHDDSKDADELEAAGTTER